MTLEEQGAYVRLLAYNWDDGYIPNDIGRLARLCGVNPKKMSSLWKSLQHAFVPQDGNPDRLVNPKLEKVRGEKKEYHETQSTNGSKGAAARWNKSSKPDGGANANAIGFATNSPQHRNESAIAPPLTTAMAKNSFPSSSPSPSSVSIPIPVDGSKHSKPPVLEEAGERKKVPPETLENVWAAIQQQLRKEIRSASGWALYWAPLKLVGFTGQFMTVTCPYDPGEDKAWMEERIQLAAIRSNHDRGRRVQLALVLGRDVWTDAEGQMVVATGVRATAGEA